MVDVFYKICILNISDVMTGSKMIKFARFSLTDRFVVHFGLFSIVFFLFLLFFLLRFNTLMLIMYYLMYNALFHLRVNSSPFDRNVISVFC